MFFISLEQPALQQWQTPQFSRNTHLSISIYIIYPHSFDQGKCFNRYFSLKAPKKFHVLTLIWVGFLGIHFLNSLELCQKLEIWYVSTQACVVVENIPFSTKDCLILLMSAFFAKNQHFFGQKYYLYSKQQCESCVRYVFQFCFQFL